MSKNLKALKKRCDALLEISKKHYSLYGKITTINIEITTLYDNAVIGEKIVKNLAKLDFSRQQLKQIAKEIFDVTDNMEIDTNLCWDAFNCRDNVNDEIKDQVHLIIDEITVLFNAIRDQAKDALKSYVNAPTIKNCSAPSTACSSISSSARTTPCADTNSLPASPVLILNKKRP